MCHCALTSVKDSTVSRQRVDNRRPIPRKTAPSLKHTGGSNDLAFLTREYTISGLAILPLRFFLGITFVYAGYQKLADPGFFSPGSRTYIGTQVVGFEHYSPIKFILVPLADHAQLLGGVVIASEVALGLLTLVGLFTRGTAVIGLSLSLGLFLSASWNTYPYFLGSDSVYAMCWLTLAIIGPGAYCLDSVAWLPGQERLQRILSGPLLVGEPVPTNKVDHPLWTRREVMIGIASMIALVIAALVPRTTASPPPLAASNAKPAAPPGTSTPGGSSGGAAGTKKVGNVSQIPVNSALAVTDPHSGDPAVVVHVSGNQFFAYDAICTHAGCTVQYDPQQKILFCPCHGAEFDPAHGAQVLAGPAPSPLTQLQMSIDSQGNVFLA